MSLSSDIREGAKKTKPIEGSLFIESKGQHFCCAQGAALYNAIGPEKINKALNEKTPRNILGPEGTLYDLLKERYPELQKPIAIESLPEGPRKVLSSLSHLELSLQIIIWKLNDSYNYSRERIADVIEELGY